MSLSESALPEDPFSFHCGPTRPVVRFLHQPVSSELGVFMRGCLAKKLFSLNRE